MQFSQLKKEKKRVSNAIFVAEKKGKKGFQIKFSQLRKGKKDFQMQFLQLNTEAGQIKYLGEATLGGQCHVPYMQVRMILNKILKFHYFELSIQIFRNKNMTLLKECDSKLK